MKSLTLVFLLSTGFLLSCSHEKHAAITTAKLEPYECGTIKLVHTLDGIFLASQPAPEDFEQFSDDGVRTVVDLRLTTEDRGFDEREVVTGLELEYVGVPFAKPDQLTDEVFDRVRSVLSEGERSILVHCASANRVGAVWLPWRVLDGGLSIEEALAEAKLVGLKNPAYEEKARDYIARHQ